MPQTSDFLEKLALFFLYNFHREHSLQKLKIKKLSRKINVKNIKKAFFIVFFFNQLHFRCENDTHEMRLLLNWQLLLSVDNPYKQIRPRSWAACPDLDQK